MLITLKIIQFAGLVLLLLVTGVFWGTWFSLSRSINEFRPGLFLAIGRVMIKNLAVPMRILMPSTIAFMIAGMCLYPDKGTGGFYFNLAAVVLIIISLLITLLVEVPIDNKIKRWRLDSLPAEWQVLRSRWQRYHTLRTFASMGSFMFLLFSILFY